MFRLILAMLVVAVAVVISRLLPRVKEGFEKITILIQIVAGVIVLFLVLSTSFIIIDSHKIGLLNRIYLGKSMPTGQIIALEGQKGPQAEILSPGFHFRFLLNILYDVAQFPVIEIPADKYGYIMAKDGVQLKEGQYLAEAWSEDKFKEMLNAEYFLKNGGQKGPQLTVLPPGSYRLNLYLFKIVLQDSTDIPAGFVGVIKSNVQESLKWQMAEVPRDLAGSLVVPLVKKGSVGVWDEPLPPGRYYLNRSAYNVTKVDTRVQIWNYKGGYERRHIDLKVTQDGKIVQKERSEFVKQPDDAADSAIFTRTESWLVPQELRVQVQVEPNDAPFLVASVGNVAAAENKVVTPALRSVVRNVCAAEKVIHLIDENRPVVEEKIEALVIPEGKKAGVTVKDVRLVDSVVPPELLVVRMREQLAAQLQLTFKSEKYAQDQRIETEKSRATADQQPELVKAEIRVKIAEKNKLAEKLKGEGEKLKLMEIAKGQKAQVKVLGEEKVMELAVIEKVLNAAVENPNIVKIPKILVSGPGGSLEGAAAILGASNIAISLSEDLKTKRSVDFKKEK